MEVLLFSMYFISGLSLITARLVYCPNGSPHHSTVGLIFAITGLILEANHTGLLICHYKISIQFSSVAQSCPTLCNPMTPSTPGLPVHHQLPEFTQTHVHWVGDTIQASHSLSSPSPPAPQKHQGLFQWVNSSREVAKVLEFHPQHQSFQWTPRTGLL